MCNYSVDMTVALIQEYVTLERAMTYFRVYGPESLDRCNDSSMTTA